ncbi:MAG: pyridoxamine 5'-phosphate oxidase family protein [Clostridia bacterium]|nr:pyridoxamine 5'-phosphate oxidase family protein [Clostridia bacterium]MBR4334592.1 pyridoxamine 5'-phosphate oxidase family protein [Clostridia bacterium]
MREMRRRDRQLTEAETMEIIQRGEYGVLCTVTPEGLPYGVPISYALDEGANIIYFHGTIQEGQKTDNLAHQPQACLTIVLQTELMPEKFATKYWSANAFGLVSNVSDEAEKRHGLKCILKKYAHDYMEQGEKYIDSAIGRARVMKMTIQSVTGKARKK